MRQFGLGIGFDFATGTSRCAVKPFGLLGLKPASMKLDLAIGAALDMDLAAIFAVAPFRAVGAAVLLAFENDRIGPALFRIELLARLRFTRRFISNQLTGQRIGLSMPDRLTPASVCATGLCG